MKRLSLLACALAAGVGLWALARDARRDAGRDVRPTDGPPLERTGPPRLHDPFAPADGTAERLDPPESPTRSAVPAAEPPAADGVTIAVVARETDTAVAGALVSFVDEPDVVERGGPDVSVDDLVARFARRFRADDEGRVVVPRPRGAGFVTAETDELWGLLMLSEDDLVGLRLELDPDPPLAVRVVDASGAPVAGVAVALRQDLGAAVTDVLIAETDASGLAALRHARPTLERIEAIEGPRPASVALAVLLAEPVERAIDVYAFPRSPVELVLPSTGSVEVRLEHPDGTPVADPRIVRMHRVDRTARWGARVETVARSGRAVFGHVGLGLELALRVDADRSARRLSWQESGPQRPGERVIASVVLDETRLTGRALGPDGSPLARTRLRGTWRLTGFPHEDVTDRTDDSGRFHLRIFEPHGSDGVVELHARTADGTRLAARVAVTGVRPGENVLGDVVLEPSPRIAAGIVLDASGGPAPGARVWTWTHHPGQEGPLPDEIHTTTDAGGRFDLGGLVDSDTVRLHASHPAAWPSEPLVVARGSEDVVLRLSAAGRIAGRLLLDTGVPPGHLHVEAVSETNEALFHAPFVSPDGSFELPGLAPDTYRLRIELREEPDCRVVFEGIVVPPGEASPDERLRAIDLRDRFRAFSLRVFDAEGEPAAQGHVRRRPSGAPDADGWREHASWMRDGRLEIVTCEPALDLEIDSVGHQLELLRGVASDRSIHLRAGPSVRLVFTGELPPLPSDARLEVSLARERVGQQRRWTRQGRRTLGPDGTLDVRLQDPGRYHVRVLLARGDAPAVLLSERAEDVIDVLDEIERQTFEVRLSPATLQRLREER